MGRKTSGSLKNPPQRVADKSTYKREAHPGRKDATNSLIAILVSLRYYHATILLGCIANYGR
jgi:hypothetical protein